MNDVTIARTVTRRCIVCNRRFDAMRSSRRTCSDRCRQRRSRQLRAATPAWPNGKFQLVYADPPWSFKTFSPNHGSGFRHVPYACMDLDAICRLPVAAHADADAVLAIWVNGAEPSMTLRVISAWGFSEPHEGLVWLKVAKNGKPHFGLGYSTRKNTETLWLAKRGKGLLRMDAGVAQGFTAPEVIVARRREHSRKPDEAYVALERLYGDVSRIELFARRQRPAWERWGNELLPDDDEAPLPFAADEMLENLAGSAVARPDCR
jgi:N6-adenosine-specific RNA methylase IME4